ncbi:MAG: putative membrane protein [Parvicella sp.]|jgi:uncharacterized membrane protein
MFEYTGFEMALLVSSLAFATLGSIAGVMSVYINEKEIKELSKRLTAGLFFGLVSGILVSSMMMVIATTTPKELFVANSLFSLLFGLWGGGIVSRKIDDKQRTEKLINEVMSAESEDEIRSILNAKSS